MKRPLRLMTQHLSRERAIFSGRSSMSMQPLPFWFCFLTSIAFLASALPASGVLLAAEPKSADPQKSPSQHSPGAVDNSIRSTFSPSALRDIFGEEAASIDFTQLMENADVGRRQYDLFVNNRFMVRQNVEIYRKPDNTLGIRFPAMVLLIQQLRFDELPALRKMKPLDLVEDVNALIPGAEVKFNTIDLRADITVPRGWYTNFGIQDDIVPPPRWTYGVPSAVLNYSANADWERYGDIRRSHGYLGLDARFNLNEWRLYANGAFSMDSGETHDRDFERGSAYLTRVFGDIGARVRAGEIYTQSFYQDALPILGIELFDDESMMSTIERGYSPVISGIAQTAARVTVRQFGRIVFERNVDPGPFTFENLPGLTSGTDLQVTVREQNGEERTFIVPFNQTTLQLRAGRTHYAAAVGRWRGTATSGDEKPFVATGAIGYGLPWDLTVFGGAQLSENYRNATVGLAVNFGTIGAASVQWDHARYDLHAGHIESTFDGMASFSGNEETQTGSRLTFEWNKHFTSTGAYMSANWRRYVSGSYLTLSELLSRRDEDEWLYSNFEGSLEDELSLSISQPLGDIGNWNLSGSLYRYDDERRRESLMTAFNTSWRGIGLSLSLQHDRNRLAGGENERETILYFNASVPLALFFGYGATSQYANFGLQRADDGTLYATEGVSGSFGENQLWSYALSASQGNHQSVVNASLSHDTGRGRWLVSASRNHESTRLSANIDGSLIAAEGELIPAQTLTGATALLLVPNAPDAKPETYAVTTKSGDWLVVTGLNNYRINEISIDPNTIPPNVLMPIYRRRLVPADDAILSVAFETMKGWQFVAEVRDLDGQKLPFGAVARLISLEGISTMDTVLNERSRAYFGAAPETGVIEVIWSENGAKRTCWAPYSIKKAIAKDPEALVIRETLVCHQAPDRKLTANDSSAPKSDVEARTPFKHVAPEEKPRSNTSNAVIKKAEVAIDAATPPWFVVQ